MPRPGSSTERIGDRRGKPGATLARQGARRVSAVTAGTGTCILHVASTRDVPPGTSGASPSRRSPSERAAVATAKSGACLILRTPRVLQCVALLSRISGFTSSLASAGPDRADVASTERPQADPTIGAMPGSDRTCPLSTVAGGDQPHRGAAVQGLTVSTPVLRNSLVFRVSTASPREAAAAARNASGT